MLELVPTSTLCTERGHLGEGTSYDAPTDTAWRFDLRDGWVFEANLQNRGIRVHRLGRMGRALARIDAARQLIASDDALCIGALAKLEADSPPYRLQRCARALLRHILDRYHGT